MKEFFEGEEKKEVERVRRNSVKRKRMILAPSVTISKEAVKAKMSVSSPKGLFSYTAINHFVKDEVKVVLP